MPGYRRSLSNQSLRASGSALAALLMLVLAACGSSGSSTSEKKGTTPGGDPVKEFELLFNPSDFGVEGLDSASAVKQPTEPPPVGETVNPALPETIAGFRIQVLITEEIDDASRNREHLKTLYPSEWIYVVYNPPYYKLRMGNYLDRTSAGEMVDRLHRNGFPDAWIVPDMILRNPPPPKDGDELKPEESDIEQHRREP